MAEPHGSQKNDDGKIRGMASRHEATIDDLYRVRGKAEIVNGELVVMAPAGGLHGYAAGPCTCTAPWTSPCTVI